MNELELQILGMSRSGNHAIADWIFAQAAAPKLLLNCAEGSTNPFHSCRPLSEGKSWRADPAIDISACRQGQHRDRRLLMHTYEDSWIDYVFSSELRNSCDAWLGHSKRRVQLLILRDPYNLFASRFQMGRNLPADIARDMWKQHARAALGYLQGPPGEFLPVLYNRWQCDEEYRQKLAERLGLEFSDMGIDRVPDCAGGSSFDGTAFDGEASNMATESRWVHFADDENFWRFFDGEMVELSNRLFGISAPVP